MLYYETIDAATLQLLKELQDVDVFQDLRLVGGTSLALQLGHRKSIDLGFFGKVDFEQIDVKEVFGKFETVTAIKKSKNINIFEINGVKVDFVNYNYPWLQDLLIEDDLRLAQKKDIAAMKIAAITGRGSKKDFVDLYYLLNEFSIEQILGFYKQKYLDASEFIALKSLSYFDDANEDLPLDMLKDISWENVKKRIRTQVIEYTE
jgi:predicted nucleotidyltransferase component of viral defense system